MTNNRLKSFFRIIILLLIFIISLATISFAQAELNQITSPDELIAGPNAEGQIGDFLFRNDSINIIVSDINHPSYYTNTGGHIIDIDWISGTGDLFNTLFTYFDNIFPNQGNYASVEIINDGFNGEPAVLRLSGVYSENNQIAVITEYSLGSHDLYITVQTWLINNSGSDISDFGLGDAIQWGGTNHFAPGYGFNIANLTTTEEWLAGKGDGVSYAYTIPSGTLTGPNGGSWSDPVSFNANIPMGDTVSYTRFLTAGRGDIASATDIVYQVRNEPTGIVNGQVVNSNGQGLDNVTIDINSILTSPYSQAEPNDLGEFSINLPQDEYNLLFNKSGYSPAEADVIVNNNDTTALYVVLGDSIGGEPYPIGDTLTYILRPISSIPAIVPSDSIFTIELDADQSTGNWQCGLLFRNLNFNLSIQSAYFDNSLQRWFIDAGLPDEIPFELYDLWITADGIADTAQSAVKIIDDYKSEFYFIQITDTHLPTHIYHDEPGGLTDTASMSDVWSLIEDFKIINPEFVLLTGDVVNEGELEDYLGLRSYSRTKRLLTNFSVPIYVAPGNHDLGGWNDTPPPAGTARRDWWRFFGWKYLDHTTGPEPYTRDFYFDYGNVRLIELEAYINYDSWRQNIYGGESFTAMQMTWLNDVLVNTDPSKSIVTFNHYDFQNQLNLPAMGIDMNLYGHIHSDEGSIANPPYNLATNNVTDGERSFRVIHYDSAGFHPQPSFSSGYSGQNFIISYSPENNGNHSEVTATINNNYNFSFNHGLVIFSMPIADSFSVDNGIITQTIVLDSTALCYVEFTIAANSITSVTIEAHLTSAAESDNVLPVKFSLMQNYPNPFNSATKISYSISNEANVRLDIYDLLGKHVTILTDEFQKPGAHSVNWDADKFSSGIYFYRLTANDISITKKMILLR